MFFPELLFLTRQRQHMNDSKPYLKANVGLSRSFSYPTREPLLHMLSSYAQKKLTCLQIVVPHNFPLFLYKLGQLLFLWGKKLIIFLAILKTLKFDYHSAVCLYTSNETTWVNDFKPCTCNTNKVKHFINFSYNV